MSVKENKAIMRYIIEEAFNKGNLAVVDEYTAPDYIFGNNESKGSEIIKQTITRQRIAFPDFHQRLDDIVAEGDIVAHRCTMTGTFNGKLGEIPPTGKQFTIQLAGFTRFANGKQVQGWIYVDTLALYRQLGISLPVQ
jgi:predicted ester cyclase